VPDSEPELIGTTNETLYRQVHPNCITAGVPTSLAFRPSPKYDEGMLSVTLASLTSAEEAYHHHTEVKGMESAGTWGILVEDLASPELVEAARQPMSAFADGSEDDPAHGFVDFRHLGRKRREAVGAVLRRKSMARGCLYTPPAEASA